jgi:hypothetical protein
MRQMCRRLYYPNDTCYLKDLKLIGKKITIDLMIENLEINFICEIQKSIMKLFFPISKRILHKSPTNLIHIISFKPTNLW